MEALQLLNYRTHLTVGHPVLCNVLLLESVFYYESILIHVHQQANIQIILALWVWVVCVFLSFLNLESFKKRKSCFNPTTHFQSCPTFVFTVLHDCCGFPWAQHVNGSFCFTLGENVVTNAYFIWKLVKAWLPMLTVTATTFIVIDIFVCLYVCPEWLLIWK